MAQYMIIIYSCKYMKKGLIAEYPLLYSPEISISDY